MTGQTSPQVSPCPEGFGVLVPPDLVPVVRRLVDDVGQRVRSGGGWLDPALVELYRALRRAEAQSDILASAGGNFVAPVRGEAAPLVSVNEIAALLGLGARQVRNRCAAGAMGRAGGFPGAHKIGRDWFVPAHVVAEEAAKRGHNRVV